MLCPYAFGPATLGFTKSCSALFRYILCSMMNPTMPAPIGGLFVRSALPVIITAAVSVIAMRHYKPITAPMNASERRS